MSRGTVLVVEGTGVSTLLEAVTDRLDPELWDHQIVDYPAEYGMAGSYAASRDIGTANLVDAIAAQKGRPVALLGYSQGAQIVGDTAELVASTGYDPLADVRAVALVSDPMRPAGKSIGGLGTGYGIAGQRDIVADFPVFWAANPLDAITCAKYDAMLRTVADFTEYMALNDVLGWALDVLTKLDSFGWQNAWGASSLLDIPRQLRRLSQAKKDLLGYLPVDLLGNGSNINPAGGQHTCYGVAPIAPGGLTYCGWIANQLNTIGETL
ncbi:PE-PPE domain-containing protein [Rhodococcus hoagii]|nr:PE-PPE domain-containing protein [Prescottella equi]NKS71565.1 PE-PPE domain-containing protein [Prescottella equi]